MGQECKFSYNYHEFSIQGDNESYWQVNDSADVSNARYFFNPTFFISPEKMINVLVKGTISVETTNDNDFIGIVFGYQNPSHLGSNLNYDFYLFDWKSESELFTSYMGYEGFRLSKYSGVITQSTIGKYFWGNDDLQPTRQLYFFKSGEGLGWEPFEKYDFELLYTVNLISIKIDGAVIFERQGCYEAGKVGFYCMSQGWGRFEDFTYQFKAEANISPTMACIEEPIYFESFDPLCTGLPSNIESITWDFGDGQTSNEANTFHSFSVPGEYPVELIVQTNEGCADTIFKTVTINPNPVVNLGNDTTLGFLDSISLEAGNDGSDFLWSTQSDQQNILLDKLTKDTTVWVIVSKEGCLGADSIRITVEPLPKYELSFPNAFSPNGDGINDVFLPVGIEQTLFAYQLLIFNRWGQLIFESDDYYQGWDGNFMGKIAPVGVYIYRVDYSTGLPDFGIEDYSASGILTLLK